MFIALTGYERSGKDTVAAFFAEFLDAEPLALADPIRELAIEVNPAVTVPGQGLYPLNYVIETWGWERAKDEAPGVRETMQNLGDGCRKIFGDDCWLRHTNAKIFADFKLKIVKDVRYDNEGQWAALNSVLFANVYRPGYGPVNSHVSAQGQAVKYADITIVNDGTLDDLKLKVKSICDILELDWEHYSKKRL